MGILSWIFSSKKKRDPGYGVVTIQILIGETPKDFCKRIKKILPHITSHELKTIRESIEAGLAVGVSAFVSKNLYTDVQNGKIVGATHAVAHCGAESKFGGGCGTDGCCDGVATGRFNNEEEMKNYFILELMGRKNWHDSEEPEVWG